MSITKKYHILVEYMPATEDQRREDGTYLIKHYEEVQEAVMSIDNRICIIDGVGGVYDSYVECIVDSLTVAEHIEKVIIAKLTSYNYRIIN